MGGEHCRSNQPDMSRLIIGRLQAKRLLRTHDFEPVVEDRSLSVNICQGEFFLESIHLNNSFAWNLLQKTHALSYY